RVLEEVLGVRLPAAHAQGRLLVVAAAYEGLEKGGRGFVYVFRDRELVKRHLTGASSAATTAGGRGARPSEGPGEYFDLFCVELIKRLPVDGVSLCVHNLEERVNCHGNPPLLPV